MPQEKSQELQRLINDLNLKCDGITFTDPHAQELCGEKAAAGDVAGVEAAVNGDYNVAARSGGSSSTASSEPYDDGYGGAVSTSSQIGMRPKTSRKHR